MHETEMFPTPAQVDEVVGIAQSFRTVEQPLDVNVTIVLPDDVAGSGRLVRDYESAGATWLQVGAWSIDELRDRIAAGPKLTAAPSDLGLSRAAAPARTISGTPTRSWKWGFA